MKTATELKIEAKAMKAIEWMVSKSQPQDGPPADNEDAPTSQWVSIDGSGFFEGTLPYRMAQDIEVYVKSVCTRSVDCGKSHLYNWNNEQVYFNISFGTYKSTANKVKFGFLPKAYVTGEA